MYYESIVFSLLMAGHSAIPGLPCHSLKPFWNEELDRLKADSVFYMTCRLVLVDPKQTRLTSDAAYTIGMQS